MLASATIVTICSKCAKRSEVRGLDYDDLRIDVKDRKVISRICANCKFREANKNREMSAKEKAYRKNYNKQRNERIKIALELLKESENEE